MDLRRRLADLSLPPPIESLIQRAVGPGSADRKHEDLVIACEAACELMAAAMWAVCRRLELRSTDLDKQLRALARPSFGHWTGLIRTCRKLLADHKEPEARALAPLLAGLAANHAIDEGTARLADRIALVDEDRRLPGSATVHDLVQALPAYRNKTQSGHHREVLQTFREESLEPLRDGLLGLCKLAPPLGAFHLSVVHRLERDEAGHTAELVILNGSLAATERCPVSEDTWSSLRRGRPYLFQHPGLFVPLFPFAAAEPSEGSWRIGWLAGRVHAPTLAYHGGDRGRFQIAVEPEEYEGLLGGFDREAGVPEAVLAMEPYRGLLAYEEEHEPLFCGREEESEQAASRLLTEGVLVACGASGSGKSSLMKAGILPRLRRRLQEAGRDLVLVSLTPGGEPLAALRGALRAAGPRDAAASARWSQTVGELLPQSMADVAPEALANLLRGLATDGREVLLCVDQLEELATQGSGKAETRRFLDLLVGVAAASEEAPLRQVMTVRADLVGRLLEHEGFRRLLDEHTLHVGGIERGRLERVILEPLRGRGVGVDPGLPEVIVADVAEQPGAVALLSQVLKTLWEERAAHGDWLTKQGYEDAGRVAGALCTQAEAARAEVVDSAGGEALDNVLCELAHHVPTMASHGAA